MGNSPPTGGIRLPNIDCSYVVTIGQSVTIKFSGRKVEQGDKGENKETWKMEYNSGTRTCSFTLCKTSFRNTMTHTFPDEMLHIKIEVTAPGLGYFSRRQTRCSLYDFAIPFRGILIEEGNLLSFDNVTRNAYGESTTYVFDIYEHDEKWKILIVSEEKIRSKDKVIYQTVACYYLNTDDDGVDIGLSVMVKMRHLRIDGIIDFAVDGPELHPVDALAYMFKEVARTKTWRPTDCPHCAKRYIDERQSESSESDIDCIPAPQGVHGRQQNAGSIVSNPGWFKGNNNGNTFINKYFPSRKR